LVYTVAAYSITLGVLALYGVSIQHRRHVAAARLSRQGRGAPPDPTRGFNLGAMLLAPIWMMAHGMRAAGAGLLVLCLALGPLAQQGFWIPLLFVGAVPLAAGAALGFVGNRIAVGHRGAVGLEDLSSSQLPWALAGIVLHVFVLPWVLFLLPMR